MWVVACHQYGLSAVVPPRTFCWENSGGGVTKWQLVSQVAPKVNQEGMSS